MGRALYLWSTGRGFNSYSGQKLRNNLGQVVHTYVPLSPSSRTWYWPRDRWCSAAGKVTAGLAESNGSLPPGGWLIVTCGLTACTPGSAVGPTLGNEYGKPLPLLSVLCSVIQEWQCVYHRDDAGCDKCCTTIELGGNRRGKRVWMVLKGTWKFWFVPRGALVGNKWRRKVKMAIGWRSSWRQRLYVACSWELISKALRTASVNEGSHRFTCHPRMEWAILPLLPSPALVDTYSLSHRVSGWVGLIIIIIKKFV